MKKSHTALIFLSGLFGGGICGYFIGRKCSGDTNFLPTQNWIDNFKKGFNEGYRGHDYNDDSCGINDANDFLIEQSKNKKYIDIDTVKNRSSKDDENDPEIESSDRKNSNNDWSDTYREYISDAIQDKEYYSESEASEEVRGELHVVEESDLSDEEPDTTEEPFVKIVSSVDFVKAIAGGAYLRSFIFNTLDKKLYWNFTEELIDFDEAKQIVSSEIIEELINESNYNSNGWVQPRYLYNATEDFYIKIEPHSFVKINETN